MMAEPVYLQVYIMENITLIFVGTEVGKEEKSPPIKGVEARALSRAKTYLNPAMKKAKATRHSPSGGSGDRAGN